MVSVLLGGVPISWSVPCVPALADSPSRGFRKGCRACLRLLGLSWLQASCASFCGGCPASSLSLGARHLMACPQDRLLPLPRTPSPRASVSEGVSPGGELVWVSEVVEALFRCGPASPSHCLALHWFRSRIGRSGMGPQLSQAMGPRWFCLWALDLVDVRGGRASGETSFSRGCSMSLVVTPGCSFPTSWRSGMLGPGWFCLWALDLVDVRGGRASGETSFSRVCRGCFRIVFDSAGSAGVVFGPT
ncbi:hypothetical protein Taro_051498 [Colocasia esculenta]|uniref:Uncharacterized protein n=1 Tax=Colocasia esculenta TaxID=4460 RepID=A0A843XGX7_COLES|nr:hypothetical protein [Colocasia esculenta]